MANVFDITNPEIVKMIIRDIESEQNRQRREDDFNSYQIESGNQREYVKAELVKMFPESHKVMTTSNINVLGKVVDRLSKVYKTPPSRLVNGKKNDNLDKIYKDGLFNRSFASKDKTFNRSRCVLEWVQNIPGMPTKFKIVPLPQYTFDIVIDNNTLELLMVILSYPDGSITVNNRDTRSDSQNQTIAESDLDSSISSKQYAIWTKDHHVNIQATGKKEGTTITFMIDPENEDQKNTLGVIPFVWSTTQPEVPEFPTPNPLAQESITINVMNSTLLTAATKQIGIMILKYPQGSEINTVHSGFTVALQLPQSTEENPAIETTAEYLVPNSDLAGMKETFLDYTAGILSDNGLEGATLTGENKSFSSGIERMIASASISDIRSQNISTYTHAEQQIFEIIKKYDEVNATRLFSTDDDLTVIFEEQKIIISEKERLEIIEKKESLGLLEEADKFAIAFPTMTPTDIEAKIKRINDAKVSLVNSFTETKSEDDDGDNSEII